MQLLAEFLRSPSDFFQDQFRQRIAIISLFSLLFVCILFSLARGAARRGHPVENLNISSELITPLPTQTKWWLRHEPTITPTGLIVGTEMFPTHNACPAYASDFKPGAYGYISLFPPYENIVRLGADRNYPAVGFIERGDWVQILADPVCAADGYVWLNVHSAAGSSGWTAGGHKVSQWVILCPDPNKKCQKERPSALLQATPEPTRNGSTVISSRNACISDKLAIGLDAQVSPSDLLVVRAEPFAGSIIGHIAPLTVINIVDGPRCAGGTIWWKVWGPKTGWAVENSLRACPKDEECAPWNTEYLSH